MASWNPEPPGGLVQGSSLTTWFLGGRVRVAGCVCHEQNTLSEAVLSPVNLKVNFVSLPPLLCFTVVISV